MRRRDGGRRRDRCAAIGSAILKTMRAVCRDGASRSAIRPGVCRRSVPGGLRLLQPSGAAGLADPGRKRLLRPQARHPFRHIVPSPEIDGPGICGMTRPLKVSALADGKVAVDKVLTIDCPMIPALEAWLNDIVQPDAEARFGQKVATLNVFGAYSCRSVDNIAGAQLSEHAFGNAVDVAGFTLADGRTIDFVRDWKKARPRRPPSCTRRMLAPASISPPCSDPARTSFTTTTSISISPTTARPTPARAASASRRPRRPSAAARRARRPAARARDRRAPRHRPSRRAGPSVALAPMSLTGPSEGPDGALPPAAIGETDPAPPILPAGAGPSVDPQPTSSIGDHDD